MIHSNIPPLRRVESTTMKVSQGKPISEGLIPPVAQCSRTLEREWPSALPEALAKSVIGRHVHLNVPVLHSSTSASLVETFSINMKSPRIIIAAASTAFCPRSESQDTKDAQG